MTQRVEGGVTYTQNFDIENRLASVTVNSQTTTFVYDGDGNLVRKIKPDGTSTVYIGGIYEVELDAGGSVTKKTSYYGAAMRVEVVGVSNTLYYVLRDHLGSASVTLDASGNVVANGEQRYYPFGESRIAGASLPTDRLYTGQRNTGLGLYHYGARFYSSALGRFISADSNVPNRVNTQSLNRYAYVYNNPLKYADPTGHEACYGVGPEIGSEISQADCWAWGRDKWLYGWDVPTPEPGDGYHTPKDGWRYAKVRVDQFDVSFQGNWTIYNMAEIVEAVYRVGIALAAAGGGRTAAEAFRNIMGPITFIFDLTADLTGACITVGNTITCDEDVDGPGIAHELGHVFDVQTGWPNSGASLTDYAGATIWDADGNYVEGIDPTTGTWTRTNSGYACDRYPCQAHPLNWQDPPTNDKYANTATEGFADMFMNWAYQSFADDTAGEARYNWMTTNMANWIAEASR